MIFVLIVLGLYLLWSLYMVKYLDFIPDTLINYNKKEIPVIVKGINQSYLYSFNFETNTITLLITYTDKYLFSEKNKIFLSRRQPIYYSISGIIMYYVWRSTLKDIETSKLYRVINYLTLEQIKEKSKKGEPLCEIMSHLDKYIDMK